MHRCGQDDRSRATTYRRRLAISALEENLGRLSRQLVDLPSSLRCRTLLQSKTTSQKLTVFRSAANRSAAFQSGRLGYMGPASARYGSHVCGGRGRNGNLSSGSVRLRCGKPGLTRRSLVSTLKQSPESRRYGCDPNHLGTAPASSTKTTSGRTADEPEAKRLSDRMATQRGERRGQGQADLPAE